MATEARVVDNDYQQLTLPSGGKNDKAGIDNPASLLPQYENVASSISKGYNRDSVKSEHTYAEIHI